MDKDMLLIFEIFNHLNEIKKLHSTLSLDEKISVLNEIKIFLKEISPFKDEPVDCVLWKKIEDILPNFYNPNKVAPPEYKLLKHSILHDGYTQPIVTIKIDGKYEIVDGFHRSKVGTLDIIKKRTHGYIPITILGDDNSNLKDRMASTIRHNRARGKHEVTLMIDLVKELIERGWEDENIIKELGMSKDEVLRLKQISGLPELFKNRKFSNSWNILKK